MRRDIRVYFLAPTPVVRSLYLTSVRSEWELSVTGKGTDMMEDVHCDAILGFTCIKCPTSDIHLTGPILHAICCPSRSPSPTL